MVMWQYSTVVDRCLRLVYQPAGVSSCSRRLTGMNVVFLSRVLPELEALPFLTSACKATSKSQNFVLPQANLHLLLKSHVAIRHCKYIDHPCHRILCQGRHELKEVQWTVVPLTPDLLRGYQAHLSLWFSPRPARSRKIVLPVHQGN